MNNPIIIAIDAMGGDNSPNKVIEGISLHSKTSKNVQYKIFGNEKLILPLVNKYKISNKNYKLIIPHLQILYTSLFVISIVFIIPLPISIGNLPMYCGLFFK